MPAQNLPATDNLSGAQSVPAGLQPDSTAHTGAQAPANPPRTSSTADPLANRFRTRSDGGRRWQINNQQRATAGASSATTPPADTEGVEAVPTTTPAAEQSATHPENAATDRETASPPADSARAKTNDEKIKDHIDRLKEKNSTMGGEMVDPSQNDLMQQLGLDRDNDFREQTKKVFEDMERQSDMWGKEV